MRKEHNRFDFCNLVSGLEGAIFGRVGVLLDWR